MRHLAAPVLALIAVAHAGRAARADDDATKPSDERIVLLNATSKLGDLGQITKLRRVLDSKGLLATLPEALEATLDGRNVLVSDIEAIKDAYANADYDAALEVIQTNEERILQNTTSGDPLPALVELSQWRGLIAAAQDEPDEAVRQFRAALRFNPAWSLDKKLVQPRVRALLKKARKETAETGRLRVDADPDTALIAIDGGKPRPAGGKVTLPAGIHLVTVTAEGRTAYSELVDIRADKTEKLAISLAEESTDDRAARLVSATVAAPAGTPRLKSVRKLSKLTGVSITLVIEDSVEDRVTVRVYDTGTKKVSRPLDIEDSASSTAIARKVLAALDPDNMIDPRAVIVVNNETTRPQRWYERWYVWAGVAAVVGGSVLGYQQLTRDPTAVRF